MGFGELCHILVHVCSLPAGVGLSLSYLLIALHFCSGPCGS